MLFFIQRISKLSFCTMLTLALCAEQACASGVVDYLQSYVFKVRENRLDLSVWENPDRLTVQEIRDNLHRFQGGEDLLQFVARRSPLLLRQFMLIADSGSLQPSSPEAPRLILFGEGLYFAMGAGGKSVEIIELDPATYMYNFHRIRFGEEVSLEDNPAVCASCHGSPARPVWQPYDFWPTVLGSHIGRFGTEAEQDRYKTIRSRASVHPIFRHLHFPTQEQTHVLNAEILTQYVQGQAFLRMSQEFKQRFVELKSIWPATLGILSRCGKASTADEIYEAFKAFLPEALQVSFNARLKEVYVDTQLARKRLKRYQQERYDRLYGDSDPLFPILHDRLGQEINFVAPLRVLFEHKNFDLRDFVTNQGVNPFFFQTPANFLNDLLLALFRVDPQGIDTLNPRIEERYGMQWAHFDCDTLAAESREALQHESEFKNNLLKDSAARASLLGGCIQCHNALKRGPPIPFDRTSAFVSWLKDERNYAELVKRVSSKGADRMPPSPVLTQEERASLLELFEELKKSEP